jgi:fibronectin type 3 domain-containing protein
MLHTYTLFVYDSAVKTKSYDRALYQAKQDLAHVLVQREKIDRKVARLQAVINDLQNLSAELLRKDMERSIERVVKGTLKLGITDNARLILKETFFPMTAVDLKKKLEAKKLDLSRYSNPLSVIHTVLKRLAKNDEVRIVLQERGKKAYQWTSITDRLLTELQQTTQPTVQQRDGQKEAK